MKHTLHNSCGNSWRMQTLCVKHITRPEQLMISIISTQPLHKWPIFKVKTAWLKHLLKSRNLKESALTPYKFYSSVNLAKLTIGITPNLQVTVQDTGHQASIFFPQAKNVFPVNAHFRDPWGFLPFNVDLPCRNPFTFLLMAVRPLWQFSPIVKAE